MKSVASLLLVAALATVTHAQQDCKDMARFECPTECNPTCGSDGRTYRSPCHLWFAQCSDTKLTKTNRGVCPNEVNWDVKQCAYAAGTDPKPSLAHPREITDKLAREPVPNALLESVSKVSRRN
jgi:hypothetical protein